MVAHDEQREADIQKLCQAILSKGAESTGDHGSGAQCPFCYCDIPWNADSLNGYDHATDCAYLIAKDISTNVTVNP